MQGLANLRQPKEEDPVNMLAMSCALNLKGLSRLQLLLFLLLPSLETADDSPVTTAGNMGGGAICFLFCLSLKSLRSIIN